MKARQAVRHPWHTNCCPVIVVALAFFVGTPVVAQLGTQYTPPGKPTSVRSRPSKDEFKIKLENSPWKAGPIYLSPWLGLQDVSLVENLGTQGQTESEDFTLTLGAGLRGYVPAGRKVIWAAHALPEYVWWQDSEAKRGLNGRYGLGLFVFFNRMTLELSQRRLEQQDFFSSEIQTLTSFREDVSTFNLEVELTRGLSLFGLATRNERRNEETETQIFSALNRAVEAGTIGLRYESARGWDFEISFQELTSDFAAEARALSNSGSSSNAAIGINRPRIGFRLSVATNDREADEGSEFGVFTETTGALDVLWKPTPGLAVLGYVRRYLSYSIDDDYSQIVALRHGASVSFKLGDAAIGLFAETGEDDFATISPVAPQRLDDVTAYGAALLVELRKMSLSVRVSQTEYDSNLVGLDREVTSLSFGIKLDAITRLTSELIERLSLGRGDTDW